MQPDRKSSKSKVVRPPIFQPKDDRLKRGDRRQFKMPRPQSSQVTESVAFECRDCLQLKKQIANLANGIHQREAALSKLKQSSQLLAEQRNKFKKSSLEYQKRAASLKQELRAVNKQCEQSKQVQARLQTLVNSLTEQKPTAELRGPLLQHQLASLRNFNRQLQNRLRETLRLTTELQSQYDQIENLAEDQFGILHIKSAASSWKSRLKEAMTEAAVSSFACIDKAEKKGTLNEPAFPKDQHLCAIAQQLRQLLSADQLARQPILIRLEKQLSALQKKLLLSTIWRGSRTESIGRALSQHNYFQQLTLAVSSNLALLEKQPHLRQFETLLVQSDNSQQIKQIVAKHSQDSKHINFTALSSDLSTYVAKLLSEVKNVAALFALDCILVRKRFQKLHQFCTTQVTQLQQVIKQDVYQPYQLINQLFVNCKGDSILSELQGKRPFQNRALISYLTKLAQTVQQNNSRIMTGLTQLHKIQFLKSRGEESLFKKFKDKYDQFKKGEA